MPSTVMVPSFVFTLVNIAVSGTWQASSMKKIIQSDPWNNEFFDVFTGGSVNSKQTLYFIGPYKGKIVYFARFLKVFCRKKFRILFLQPSEHILDSSQPEWLGKSIEQAMRIIITDMAAHSSQQHYLVGVSLGSYLGLNVQLQVSFKKFVIVAGGAPLRGVSKSSGLLKQSPEERATSQSLKWAAYSDAYKGHDFSGSSTLLINSWNDRVLNQNQLRQFLEAYKKTGVQIINHQKGKLPHNLQALSLNLRCNQVEKFFNS